MTDTKLDPLAYYAQHNAALFPIPHGQKKPTGIVSSFVEDCSSDPAQWERWRAANPGCNFGIVAGHSGLIIVDVDAAKYGRDEAWGAYCKLCFEVWNLSEAPAPQVQSARGGWHVLFRVPSEIDARGLTQPDAIKGIVNVRAGNGFVVAAGSYYDGTLANEESGFYTLLNNAAPYPAPSRLVEHCTRSVGVASSEPGGDRDSADVAALLTWMAERDMFTSYDDWIGCGMGLRLALGDAGLDLWRLTFIDDGKDKNEESHWRSFADEPTPRTQTIKSLYKKAHDAGWTGTVRQSIEAMFSNSATTTVAKLAADAGANLSSAVAGGMPIPQPGGGTSPMFGNADKMAELAAPEIERFNKLDGPLRPSYSDIPTFPEGINAHALYAPLTSVIPRLLAMCESKQAPHKEILTDIIGIVWAVWRDTGLALLRRVQQHDIKISERQVKLKADGFKDRVDDALNAKDDWVRDYRQEIKSNHFQNLSVYYGRLGLEIRFNGWLERIEINRGSGWKVFDDAIECALRMNATTLGYDLKKDFHWDAAAALAHQNTFDPAINYLAECEKEWDGTPRLVTWLTIVCGVECDPYHQMVGKSIVGGMVRRIREPGCKHDEMAVLCGVQGTGKSTLAKVLCPDPEWFTESVKLGDEAKELVLKLKGRAVCEIPEMASRRQIEDVKAMLTTQVDSGRPAYGRAVVSRPRRNIFIGSTNHEKFLIDETGNRRFLPVVLRKMIDLEWIEMWRRQLIGEAAALHTAGQNFRVPSSLWSVAAERQESARAESDHEIKLADLFGTESPYDVAYITAADLIDFSTLSKWRIGNRERGDAMRKLGFVDRSLVIFGKKTRVWMRAAKEILPRYIETHAVQYVVDGSQAVPRIVVRLPQAAAPSVPGQWPAPR